MTSPTQKSLQKYRKEGYLCYITETFNRFAGVRQDLFGFIDILCVKENEVVGIQTTSQNNLQARVEKILKHKNYPIVKSSGIIIVVEGWAKVEVGKRLLWQCKSKNL